MREFDGFMSKSGLYSARPQMVGFNIRSFDMPWIRHHAYKFRLDRLAEFTPWQRYDKIVLDLREVWTGGDLRAKGTLNEICRFLGLGKKLADGGKVFKMWQDGDWDAIAGYNRHEVELIRELWRVMFPYSIN